MLLFDFVCLFLFKVDFECVYGMMIVVLKLLLFWGEVLLLLFVCWVVGIDFLLLIGLVVGFDKDV